MEDAGHPVLKGWRSYMLVEPPMLLHFFGQALTVNVIEDFLVNRCCRAQLDTNSRECATFRNDFMVRESRQWVEVVMPYFFFIMMVKYFIDGVIPACTLLFLGSWSDKYGRKPILLAGYAGSATSCLLWSILSSLDLLNPWFYLIASVPAALVGGYSSLNFATNCYITDITSDRQRAWHLTWLIPVNYAAWFFGFPAGTAIYKGFGYSRVFGAASACSAISMLYVLIFVPETVATSREKKHAYRSLFDLSLIKDTIATCVRKREDTNRLILWWCILYLSMIVLAEVGDFRIMFSIASERFGWREDDRIVYQLKERLLSGVGILLSAKIITSFIDKSMSSMLIVVFALTSSLFGAIVVENATEPRHLYLFVVFVMFSQLSKPVLRTALSKSVPPRDIGKVFSLASFMEIMMFLVAKLLYAFFYSYRRRPTHPSLIFIISAEIYVNAIAGVMPINRTFQLWNSAREQHSRRD